MSAANLVLRLRDEQPLVVELAAAASIPGHVDVALLRSLRRELVQAADVTTEADLWSSDLVDVRSGPELSLRADVEVVLWQELRAADKLERTYQALVKLQPPERPLQALEHRITYLAIKEDRDKIDSELRSVIKAMLDDPSRRRDLSAWAARVLARLYPAVRDSEAAQILAAAATSWVATPTSVAGLAPNPQNLRLANQLRAKSDLINFWLRRVGSQLEVTATPASPGVSVALPRTDPRLIIDEDATYRIDPRGVTTIPLTRSDVMLGAPDGRRWTLTLQQPVPNLDAVVSFQTDLGNGAAYLVSSRFAVTSASLFSLEGKSAWAGVLIFGRGRAEARTVALDRVADVAILELSQPAPVRPLELHPGPHAGEIWQAFVLETPVEGGNTPATRWNRWLGTVASAGDETSLRGLPGEDVRAVFPPGLPIFTGERVIGHFYGRQARDGVLPVTGVANIRRWLARIARDERTAARQLVIVPRASSQQLQRDLADRLGALSSDVLRIRIAAPDLVGDFRPSDLELAADVRRRTPHSLASDADLVNALLQGYSRTDQIFQLAARAGVDLRKLPPDDLPLRQLWLSVLDEVDRSNTQSQFLSTIAAEAPTLTSIVESRNQQFEAMLVGAGVACPEDVQREARIAGIEVRLFPSVDDAISGVRLDLRGVEEQPRSERVPDTWIHSARTEQVPREMEFQGAASIQKNDLVVMFVGEPDRQYPGGIYRVIGGRRIAESSVSQTPRGTSADVDCALVIELHPRNVADHRREIAALANVTATRTTRNLNVHDRLIELLIALCPPKEVARVVQYLGVPEPYERARTLPIIVRIPERVSFDGLLSPIVNAGDVQHVDEMQWAQHPVSVWLEHEQRFRAGAPFVVTIKEEVAELPDRDVHVMVFPSSEDREHAHRGFERAAAQLGPRVRFERASESDASDLELTVYRLAAETRASAMRRAMSFVVAALENMDNPPANRGSVFLRISGSDLDLRVVQERMTELGRDSWTSVISIDLETQVIELKTLPSETPRDASAFVEAFRNAFRVGAELMHTPGNVADPLTHRFGVSATRAHRTLRVEVDPSTATLIVQSVTKPVLGYVSFYWTDSDRNVQLTRVRASGGVARCLVPRRSEPFAVGAIVEDEGVQLEGLVAPIEVPTQEQGAS